MGPVVAVVCVTSLAVVAVVPLLALGVRDGDHPGDPHSDVVAGPDAEAQIVVRNPSPAVLVVSSDYRRRLPLIRRRESGLHKRAARLALVLSLSERRVRRHDHPLMRTR